MMLAEVMKELEIMGTAQNRKVYKRHGAGDNLFGVSFANLKILKKKIKVDHALALQLWRTGNTDARTLACMVADPQQLTKKQSEAWVKEVAYNLLSGYVGSIVAESAHADTLMHQWMASDREYVKETGYSVLTTMLKNDASQLSDKACREMLKTLEADIHKSPNWARYGMNWALIAIGTYKLDLMDAAIEAAARIGKVEVDHGETSCKTPDAASYIKKAAAHQRNKLLAKTK